MPVRKRQEVQEVLRSGGQLDPLPVPPDKSQRHQSGTGHGHCARLGDLATALFVVLLDQGNGREEVIRAAWAGRIVTSMHGDVLGDSRGRNGRTERHELVEDQRRITHHGLTQSGATWQREGRLGDVDTALVSVDGPVETNADSRDQTSGIQDANIVGDEEIADGDHAGAARRPYAEKADKRKPDGISGQRHHFNGARVTGADANGAGYEAVFDEYEVRKLLVAVDDRSFSVNECLQ